MGAKAACKNVGIIDSETIWVNFTNSFYASRFQKCKKDSQLKQLFALSGSASVKTARKQVGEIDSETSWREKSI